MTLKEKIEDHSAQVGVIGLSYVGLPLAMEFIHAGFKVTGIDIDESKVKQLNKGQNYDPHYLSWKLKALDYDARFI